MSTWRIEHPVSSEPSPVTPGVRRIWLRLT